MADKIRVGVIGLGNMGSAHSSAIFGGEIGNMTLCAVCDINEERKVFAAEKLPGIPFFSSSRDLIKSGLIDAVIIATPHYLHPEIAVEALSEGLHVLTEKPAGVYTKQVKEMLTAARKSGKTLGVMFNQRTNQLFKKAKELFENGSIGELKRVNWIITNWYRSQYYYDSGDWRATWRGEGGGVLLNQAPHNLDAMIWICGMPEKVKAQCNVGKYHNIEVEDEAIINGIYKNGATFSFITSTGEFPGTNRLEITGDKGKITVENGTLTFVKLKASEKEVRFESRDIFPVIETETEIVRQETPDGAHKEVLCRFADCILSGSSLIADGQDGLAETELSNAAYLSAWTDKWVKIPIDDDKYKKELFKRIRKSEQNKRTVIKDADGNYSERWSVRW